MHSAQLPLGANVTASAATLDEQLVQLVHDARSFDIRSFESTSAANAMGGLALGVEQLVAKAIALADQVLDHYEGDISEPDVDDFPFAKPTAGASSNESMTFYQGIDELMSNHGEARVADIAFLASTELHQKLATLRRLHEGMVGWEVVGECGSALRRVVNSLTALEVVLCEVEGLEPRLTYATELSRSLQVRRQYRLLRQAIGDEPAEHEIRRRLRRIGTRIAMLIGHEIYPNLRVHDRSQIRKLQERILDWLMCDGETGACLLEGQRLWQDFDGFAGLIHQVSRRQELEEHDSVLLTRLMSRPEEALADAFREEGAALEGLDDELDTLIDQSAPDPAELRRVLERVLASFSPRSGSMESTLPAW